MMVLMVLMVLETIHVLYYAHDSCRRPRGGFRMTSCGSDGGGVRAVHTATAKTWAERIEGQLKMMQQPRRAGGFRSSTL